MSIIQDRTVLLIGSAVSSFAPVAEGGRGLPTGLTVVRQLLTRLFPDWYGADKDCKFTSLVDETPFEQILEHYPDSKGLKDIFSAFFDARAFNPIHGAIADEIVAGRVEAIITTNYDRCLEGALDNRGKAYSVIATADDDRSDVPIFKIHGTAERADTIVATLAAEYCLPDWKFELLASLIKDRHLILLGFSGRDFDICPALFSSLVRPVSVAWVEPSPNMSVNLRSALKKAVTLERRLFDEVLSRSPDDDDPATSRFKGLTWSTADAGELVDAIFARCSTAELHRWRFRLLNALALARYMKDELRETRIDKSVSESELHLWEADLAEREGRYDDSIRCLRQALGSCSERGDMQSIALTLIGRLYTARQAKSFLKSLLRSTLHRHQGEQCATLFYLYGLLAKGVYRHPKLRAARWLTRRLGLFALRQAAERYYSTGKWQSVYLCQIQSQDLDGQLDLRKVGAFHFFNLASDGFRHLNNFVGQISADRKHNPTRFADVQHVKKVIDDLEWLGLYPEIWKLAEQCYTSTWKADREAAKSILSRGRYCAEAAQVSEEARKEVLERIGKNLLDLQHG